MIIETTGSIYEVRETESRFRRIHEFGEPATDMPVGEWHTFQRMSPVEAGQPVRFFWILGQAGRVSRIGLWETSPVARILEDGEPWASTPPFQLSQQRGAALG